MYPVETQYFDAIAALMKQGRLDEITEFFKRGQKQNEETFTSYMEELIANSGMSRSKIITQVGLSRDYMYKVLRGDKKTTERDYIIAVCLSMKANILETQKALELYPFPPLDSTDPRSAIIMAALNQGTDRYTLDDWLEKMNLPLLRISPDMPSVKVGPIRSTQIPEILISSKSDEGHDSSHRRRFITMEKTNTFVVAEHVGVAPFDYFFMGEFELTGANGQKVYAQACFWPDGSAVYGIQKHSIQENIDEPDLPLEEFNTLEDASESVYFPYYLELEKLTDKKAAETMAAVDDGKNYGLRTCTTRTDHGFMIFAELYNSKSPERNEYLQIRQTSKSVIYSASHKSYYMQEHLNNGLEPIYEAYFGKPEKRMYLFEASSLEELGSYEYCRPLFEQMLSQMGFQK